MNSFKRDNVELSLSSVWLMNSIAEYKGKQELYEKQSPQALKSLVEIALIESAESSNRIEGVTVERNRLKPLIIGHSKPRDRSEEEVAGYRKALDLIHTKHESLRITPETIRELHRLCRGEAWDAGKYISIERITEQSKETYYESLNKSSQKWHQAKHDIFPWFNYFLGTILAAYKEFEARAGNIKPSRGAKTGIVINAIENQHGEFSISDIERACPNVSRVMIKKVLLQMQKDKKIKCLSKGQSAKWQRMVY